jgi:hypothetical protein
MKIVFHFHGTEALRRRLEPMGGSGPVGVPALGPPRRRRPQCVRQRTVEPGHPLLALENVVAAPHLAWLTRETLERSIKGALRNTERLRAGLPLENRVA